MKCANVELFRVKLSRAGFSPDGDWQYTIHTKMYLTEPPKHVLDLDSLFKKIPFSC